MKCRHKANLLIIPYADNQLSDGKEMEMVIEHLTVCEYCRDELEDHKKFVEWLKPLKLVYPSEERFNQIFEDACKRVEIKRQLQQEKSIPMVNPNLLRQYFPRIKPAITFVLLMAFLISSVMYLKVTSFRHSIVYSLPTMVTRGTVKVWHEKDILVFEPEIGEEFIIDTSDNARIRFKTPNAQVEAGSNTHLYLKPEKDKPTTVGVVYAYDSVSLLTKHSSTNLSSGTTAYVYPDGTVSKPRKIPETQLKRWQEELDNKIKEKQGKS